MWGVSSPWRSSTVLGVVRAPTFWAVCKTAVPRNDRNALGGNYFKGPCSFVRENVGELILPNSRP